VYRVKLPWSRRRRKPGKELAQPMVSLIKRNLIEGGVDRQTIGKFILKLAMKDKLAIVKLVNDSEIPGMLAKFSETVDYGRGETLHIVSAVETVSMVIDSANLERLTRMVLRRTSCESIPTLLR